MIYYDPNGHDGIGDCPTPNQAENDKQKVAASDYQPIQEVLVDNIGQDTDTPDLYHYTTTEGAEAIQSSGVIKTDDRGRVFVTTDQIPSR